MKTPPSLVAWIAVITAASAPAWAVDGPPKTAGEPPPSEARTFAHEAGVVELLVIGPAAKTLYDRLPGKGKVQACGASGLHKGDGKISCRKDDGDYACWIWIDAGKQTLTEAETDDC